MKQAKRGAVLALAVGALLSVALAGAAREEKAVEPSKKVVGLLGDDVVGFLKGATKVEAFRIKPEKADKEGVKTVGGYPITATGKEQGKEFAGKLLDVLFADATYEGRSARCFEPGVAFRAWTDKKESVEVIICFKCSNLSVISHDANGKVKETRGGGGFGETPSWTALVKLAKEAFPDDKEIQALKEDAK
jgi:hypothetical protein